MEISSRFLSSVHACGVLLVHSVMLNWNVLPRTYAFMLKCAREVFPLRKINLFPLMWVSLFCLDVTREFDPYFCAILETDFNVLGNEWCRNCGPKFIHLDIYNLLLFMIWIWKWFELDLVMLLLNSWFSGSCYVPLSSCKSKHPIGKTWLTYG